MGFMFVPMNLVAFATLPPHLRTDGTALTNLIRNVGSAIGVSHDDHRAGGKRADHALADWRNMCTRFNRALGVNAPEPDVESRRFRSACSN